MVIIDFVLPKRPLRGPFEDLLRAAKPPITHNDDAVYRMIVTVPVLCNASTEKKDFFLKLFGVWHCRTYNGNHDE